MDRKEARKCDRYSLFAIDAAKQAIEDAAMDLDNEDKNRIGVIFASGIGGIKTFDEEVLSYAKIKDTIGPKFNPFFIPKMISDIAAGLFPCFMDSTARTLRPSQLVHLLQTLSVTHSIISV